jgi:hypothetical protein
MPEYTLAWEAVRTVSVTQQASAAASNRRTWRLWRDDMHTATWLIRDYECDGSTAGTKGDGTARILADANVVGAAPGVAHSWAVDTVHGSLGQLCTDWDSTSDGAFSVYWSPSAGFTGGTTTARPTATDEREITQGTNGLHTLNGAHGVYSMACLETGKKALRVFFLNSAATAGPCAVLSLETAAGAPAAWSPAHIARWMGGAGTFGNRSDWTGTGWVSVVAGTTRVMTADGTAPQSGLDPDSNRLLEPTGLTHAATLGKVGFVNDWWFVDDAVTANLRYTNAAGADPRQVFDEIVTAWPSGPDLGGGSSTAVALRALWEPAPEEPDAVAPTVTLVSPSAAGDLAVTYEQALFAPVVFDVTDAAPGLRSVIVTLLFDDTADGPNELVIYRRGSIRRGFTGTVSAITNGYRVTINAPTRGWPGPFTLGVDLVDQAGNENG